MNTVSELLGDPARWTKGAQACDKDDYVVSASHSTACRWCLAGAIIKVFPDNFQKQSVYYAVASQVIRERSRKFLGFLAAFNDAP